MSHSDLETLELEEIGITQNLEEECDKSPLNNCKNDGILDKLCKYHFLILISNYIYKYYIYIFYK